MRGTTRNASGDLVGLIGVVQSEREAGRGGLARQTVALERDLDAIAVLPFGGLCQAQRRLSHTALL